MTTHSQTAAPAAPSRKNDPTPAEDAELRVARRRLLGDFFAPRTVALIGASEKEGSVGRSLLENLFAFDGQVYPVNPNHAHILHRRSYPCVKDVPQKVDLAVIATPATTVPGVVRECVRAGVKAAIICSAGFRECGASGAELERQFLAEARAGGLRLIGPNCLGLMAPHLHLNATFAPTMARPGSVAFISQSGALCTAVLDWSLRENVGLSAMVSVGSMLLVSGDRIVALDARVVLHGPDVTEERLPRLAIRPYPHQYTASATLTDGTPIELRSIRPEDEALMVRFHQGLSNRSVYFRYFTHLSLEQRTKHARLARLCFIDYDREGAVVAVHVDRVTGENAIIGVGRLCKSHGHGPAEFAVIVSDRWQRRGAGTLLLRKLVEIGREEKISCIRGSILGDNFGMRHACERAGFTLRMAG